jgi:putative transposase
MPWGLKRFQQTGQSHFVTFSCYRRQPFLNANPTRRIFELALERVRHTFGLRVYAYVVMPEHVHVLLSEPDRGLLADALKSLKQGVSRRLIATVESDGAPFKPGVGLSGNFPHTDGAPFKPGVGLSGDFPHHFWQKRYYDFNVRNYHQFVEKIDYIHQNPVKRGLCERAEEWKWSSFLQYATGCAGQVEIECEWTARRRERGQEHSAQQSNYSTQAKRRLEWGTRLGFALIPVFDGRRSRVDGLTLLTVRTVRRCPIQARCWLEWGLSPAPLA